jgi:S-adenosylmethionine-dependent methyltransferase
VTVETAAPTSPGGVRKAPDTFSRLADKLAAHYRTLRGVVRHALVTEQVVAALPPEQADIVDVGAGAGLVGIELARLGHHVTLVDPSTEMVGQASEHLAAEPADVAGRVRIVQARAEDAPAVLGRRFDVVCCHAVLPHVPDPQPVLSALGGLAAPGAVVSVLAKNADALAFPPALRADWAETVRVLTTCPDADVGGLGVRARAHRLADLTQWLDEVGVTTRAWYGIRVFTNHLHGVEPGPDLAAVLAAERLAAATDPYRAVARLLHLVGRRR